MSNQNFHLKAPKTRERVSFSLSAKSLQRRLLAGNQGQWHRTAVRILTLLNPLKTDSSPCFWFISGIIFFNSLLFTSCAVRQPPVPTVMLNKEAVQEMKKEKGYWIEVQIPQRKLVLAKGGHIIKVFPIAVGMPSYPTPVGFHQINQIIWNPWWHPPKTSEWVEDPTPVAPRTMENPLGEIKMPLGKAYLIHGTKAVRSIGQWASHGCIRMLFEDIFGLTQLLLTEYSRSSAIDAMERANKERNKEFYTKLEYEIPVVLTYDTVKVHGEYVAISPDLYSREKDRVAHIANIIEPYLKKKQTPSNKKIKNVLKLFKDQTINVPLETLVK